MSNRIHIIAIIVLVIAARIIEAVRDVEDFARGAQDMTFLWHALKYPQYLCWVLAGKFTETLYRRSREILIFVNIWVIALFGAWIIFEIILGNAGHGK